MVLNFNDGSHENHYSSQSGKIQENSSIKAVFKDKKARLAMVCARRAFEGGYFFGANLKQVAMGQIVHQINNTEIPRR